MIELALRHCLVVLLLLAAMGGATAAADEGEPAGEKEADAEGVLSNVRVDYDKGLNIWTTDDFFRMHIEVRVQLRLTRSSKGDDALFDDPEVVTGTFGVSRARLKVGGHAYKPWLGYYIEYDFSSNLLDLRLTLEHSPELLLRVGQWKVPYNRERVDSSGKLELVDRSIVNPVFTVDRQQGMLLFGRLFAGTIADSRYNLGVYGGTGRGGGADDGTPMVSARYQWNFLGRDLPFSEADLLYREKPAASVAVAAAFNRSAFTAFSSQGGGQLPGFEEGEAGQYEVRQAMVETALHYAGFSFQQEYHWKRVDDTVLDEVTDMEGGYVQVGLFPHTLFEFVPRSLEVALRGARIDPDTAVSGDSQRELTLGFNWFFDGHRNKLTLDVSRLEDEAVLDRSTRENRLRLQWDISF